MNITSCSVCWSLVQLNYSNGLTAWPLTILPPLRMEGSVERLTYGHKQTSTLHFHFCSDAESQAGKLNIVFEVLKVIEQGNRTQVYGLHSGRPNLTPARRL